MLLLDHDDDDDDDDDDALLDDDDDDDDDDDAALLDDDDDDESQSSSSSSSDDGVDEAARAGRAHDNNNGDHNDNEWLDFKLKRSSEWLIGADKEKVSIQVLLLKKSGAQELVYLLRHDWPLNLDETYLYEVNSDSRVFYRVFYRELDNVAQGRREIQNLPESIRANSPYVHSVYRMQKVFL